MYIDSYSEKITCELNDMVTNNWIWRIDLIFKPFGYVFPNSGFQHSLCPPDVIAPAIIRELVNATTGDKIVVYYAKIGNADWLSF